MAEGGLDINAMMAMRSLIDSSSGGGGRSGAVAGILQDVQMTSTSLTNLGPLKNNIPSLIGSGTGRGMFAGAGEKFLAAIQNMGDGFLKSLPNTGIQAPSGGGSDFIGHGLGGGFGGDREIGA